MKIYLKRLNHEKKNIMENLKNNYYSYKNKIMSWNHNNYNLNITVWDKFKLTSISLDFTKNSSSYPFIPPDVKLNNKNYLQYFCKKSSYYHDNKEYIVNKLDINEKQFSDLFGSRYCRGCYSILCKSKWIPIKNITNIIDEVIDNINYDNKLMYLLFIKKITMKFTNKNIYQKIYEFI